MARRFLAEFAKDDRGGVGIITGLVATVLFSFVALTLDAGSFYTMKRRQQAATDMAALAAGGNLGAPAGSAGTSMTANGFAASAITRVELGTYVSNAALSPSQRFTPQTSSAPNAVRITAQTIQPFMFGTLIGAAVPGGNGSGVAITTQSIATPRSMAAFALGSNLANLNNGVANGVLGSLLGSSLSLSLMDYQGLAATNINLFTFSNALAVRANLAAGTYGGLATANVSLGAALRAVADAAAASQASTPLATIIAAAGTTSSALRLASLVNYGPYGTLTVGAAGPMSASIDALDLVSALMQAANGSSPLTAALSTGVPGVVSATVQVAVGEPAVGASLLTLGPAGAVLTTAQTRILLTLQLAGVAPATVLTVPVAINIAYATATLNSVACTFGDVTTSAIQIGVTPGVASAWIGAVTAPQLDDFSTPVSPGPATMVNLSGLLKITAQAHAAIANPSPTTVPFTYADIALPTRKTVSTTDVVGSLLTSLFANTQLTIAVLGFIPMSSSALNLALMQTLAADATPIDGILSSVLTALGVSVGNATVWVSGVQCGQAVLVN